MKTLPIPLSLGAAAAAALLVLSACQSNESPTETSPAVTDGPFIEDPEVSAAPVGRKATDAEVARIEAALKEARPTVIRSQSPAPLAKAAALPICKSAYGTASALNGITDKAYSSLVTGEYYVQKCNTSYFFETGPWIGNRWKLIPEAAGWCKGSPFKIGTWSNGTCAMQTDASLVPRMAGNVGGDSKVHLLVIGPDGKARDWNFHSIYARSGTLEIMAYRPGIGWWYWYPLASPKKHDFGGTPVSDMLVYSENGNGNITFDNVEIAIIP